MRKSIFITLLMTVISAPAFSMINGLKVDKGYEAIGSLRTADMPAGSSCTATLIAPDWIVTAEHCIWGGSEDMPEKLDPSQVVFQLGTNAKKPLRSIKLKRWVSAPTVMIDGEEVQLDLSFAQLAQPITHIAPIPVQLGSLDVTKSYEVVGFGYESIDGYGSREGTKKMAQYKVTTLSGDPILKIFKSKTNFEAFIKAVFPDEEADLIMGDGLPIPGYQVHAWDERGRVNGKLTTQPRGGWSNTCNGDSGGPMIEKTAKGPRVVGIISSGYTGAYLGCVPVGSMISIFGPAVRDVYKTLK